MNEVRKWPDDGGPVRVETLEGGAVWRARLSRPRANIIDAGMTRGLTAIFERAAADRALKAVILEGEGPHFSYGASVEEHLPGRFDAMIRGFHGLILGLVDASVVTLAAVRGQCLGGALELASVCHRVVAAPDAKLAQPEIVLGVFAPVASVALAERVGRGAADDLCLSGRSIDAVEALRIGLVDAIADDPAAAAIEYAREHLVPRSASSLRLAARAARLGYARRLREGLAETERLYLTELMATSDAVEGLRAFLDKRPPVWRNE